MTAVIRIKWITISKVARPTFLPFRKQNRVCSRIYGHPLSPVFVPMVMGRRHLPMVVGIVVGQDAPAASGGAFVVLNQITLGPP